MDDEEHYPQYYWFSNLKKGLEALKKLRENQGVNEEELVMLVEKGKQAYKGILKYLEISKRIKQEIEDNRQLNKFRDTAIYYSQLYSIEKIPQILEHAKDLSS